MLYIQQINTIYRQGIKTPAEKGAYHPFSAAFFTKIHGMPFSLP